MFKKKKNGCAKNAPAAAGSRGRNFIPTLGDPPTQVVTRPPSPKANPFASPLP